MDTLLQDLRYAVKMLRAKPGLTLTAVATLAIGIRGSTAISSLVSAVLLGSLPFRDAQRRALATTVRAGPGGRGPGRHPERREVHGDRRDAKELSIHGELRRPLGAGGAPCRGAGRPWRALPDRRGAAEAGGDRAGSRC